jgi:hypothetical protein
MDRRKKQPEASKQHLLERGVCKNFSKEKKMFTEEKRDHANW